MMIFLLIAQRQFKHALPLPPTLTDEDEDKWDYESTEDIWDYMYKPTEDLPIRSKCKEVTTQNCKVVGQSTIDREDEA